MQVPLSAAIWIVFTATSGAYLGSAAHIAEPMTRVSEQSGEKTPCASSLLGSTTVATLNGTPLITVLANGSPLVLIVDSGAQRTIITPTAASRVSGERPRVEFERNVNGIGGSLPGREIELRSYDIGGVPIPWHRVTVAPIATPPIFSTSLDGVLGVDVLGAFDVDLDLPHHHMALYERGHCKDPNWSGPYVKLEAGHSRSDHLFFPVLLDNHGLTATIDTGSQNTVLSTVAAHRLGLAESSLVRDRPVKTKGAAGEVLNSHVHKFTQLKIGSIRIPGPEIVVTDLRLPDVDIVLGMDLFRTRRLWLSYASSSVFVAER